MKQHAAINWIQVNPEKEGVTESLLKGEIKGAEVFYHVVQALEDTVLHQAEDQLVILLVIDGQAKVESLGNCTVVEEKGTYIGKPGAMIQVQALSKLNFLEIHWYLDDGAKAFIRERKTEFPIVQAYEECSQYREDFKSKKSISRSMVDHHLLPGFCMGSNESYGPDIVEKHAHPLLDQFFFSFEENDVNLLIDEDIHSYGGNSLIHIPLGSNHGVEIPAGKKMHYVWIDFMVDAGAVSYLEEVHKKTGVKEKFNEKNMICEGEER